MTQVEQRKPVGAALLECMFAVTIFAVAAVAIYTVVMQSIDASARVTRYELAADIARTGMSQIEAGVLTPETLNGPWREWGSDQGAFDESKSESLWRLEVSTEPSQFEGLTLVRVKSILAAAEGSEQESASFELVQLVKLGQAEPTDEVERDPLEAEAKKAERAPATRQPARQGPGPSPARQGRDGTRRPER